MSTATIYDVAREARVSMATVSRVVNNNPNVKAATRERVQEVIERLKYTPNAVARGLASKKTTTIGIVLPDIADLASAEAVSGIESVAHMYKYNIILANSSNDKDIEKEVFQSFQSKQVDGILYLGHSMSEESRTQLKKLNIPVVLSGNLGEDTFYSVNIDYEKASYDITAELLQGGREKVSIVISSFESPRAQRIIAGYKKAYADNKKKLDSNLIIEGYRTYKEAAGLLTTLQKNKADVVLTMFDEVAISVLHQAQDKDLNVPSDFEIVSFENTKLLDITRPKISSVFHPIFDVGAVAMRILTKVIEIEKAKSKDQEIDEELAELERNGKEVNLPHRIVHRQTTR
ncbi:MAG: LacI family DNA-binding transcriptional regulator [Gemella sp.]|nr:LacI family DNA-binding transcriptional regulator [Gemella sp.]